MNEITAPIVLILTIVMPGNVPVNKALSMPTVEECFSQAQEWDRRGLTSGAAIKGAIAVRASCQLMLNGFPGS